MARVLVVEADTRLRSAISHFLRDSAFDVREAATYDEARRLLGEAFDAVVLEHRSRDGEAFDLLPALFARGPRPVVIVLTAHGSIDLALRLVNAGVKIVFNYSPALIDTPADVQVHTSNPAVELLYGLTDPDCTDQVQVTVFDLMRGGSWTSEGSFAVTR